MSILTSKFFEGNFGEKKGKNKEIPHFVNGSTVHNSPVSCKLQT